MHLQFCCLILASLFLLYCPYLPINISSGESVMPINEIICCDWGLVIAVVGSNLQFQRTGSFFWDPRYLFMSKNCPNKHSISLVHKQQNQVLCTSELLVWHDDCYMWWKVLFIVASNRFAAASLRWNNKTVMVFWPQSELLGNLTWIWPSLQGGYCREHVKSVSSWDPLGLLAKCSECVFSSQYISELISLYSCLVIFKTNYIMYYNIF